MANTSEMIRIMREAADLLTKERDRLVSGNYNAAKVAAAMQYGASILAMAAQTVEATR